MEDSSVEAKQFAVAGEDVFDVFEVFAADLPLLGVSVLRGAVNDNVEDKIDVIR